MDLFLWKYSSIMHSDNAKKLAIEILDSLMESDNDLFVIDNSRGFDREIPYLENGSSGVALIYLAYKV